MLQICNIMKSPFVYGKIAAGACFTDRESETESLVRDFLNLTNTILISPRRWGKSSLVRKAGEMAKKADPRLRMCYLDIFNVRTEEEFYKKLAVELIRCSATKVEEITANAMRFASRLIPSISAGDPLNKVSISFNLNDFTQTEDDILDMAEKIAQEKNLNIVVCIDEFQQIASFADPDAFQARLRSHWQHHQRVAYCLYGSRRHMMMEVFTNREKPFFQFGKTLFLEKIPREKWPPFIQEKFSESGKTISEAQCFRIAELVEDNPYYIQQLCEEVWNRTENTCSDAAISEAFEAIVSGQGNLNLALTQTLTITQQNLLHAIVNGEKLLSSATVLDKYGLKNSLTVQRAKNALAKMDIIDTFGRTVTMEDPVYAYWLKNIYFGTR